MADKIQKILCGLKEKNELLKEGIKKKVSVTHSAFAALIREFRDISGKAEKIKGEGTDKPADLMEIADLIEKILTLATYCSIGYMIAQYRNQGIIYWFAFCSAVFMCAFLFCKVISYIASYVKGDKWKSYTEWTNKLGSRIWCKLCESKRWRMGTVIGTLLLFWFGYSIWISSITEYYAMVTEVYGMPDGVGEALSWRERGGRAGYWKIQKFHHKFVLTYVEPYGQLEVMRQHSTAYSMSVFKKTSRIVYDCKKNKGKYRSIGEEAFSLAEDFGFLEPVRVSYYGSDGKLHMEMERNRSGRMEITNYSSEDQPQLLQSTLLRTPEGETDGNDMKSQQFEVTYNPDGRPLTCSLSSGKKNSYGVNGERYVYQDGYLSAVCYLDNEGNPVCNNLGVMMIEFCYEDGNLRSIRYYSDEEGLKRTDGFYGVAIEEFDYEKGNLVERREKGQNENWEYDTNQVYRYRYSYNEKGMLTKEEYYGIDGNRVREKNLTANELVLRSIRLQLEGGCGLYLMMLKERRRTKALFLSYNCPDGRTIRFFSKTVIPVGSTEQRKRF